MLDAKQRKRATTSNHRPAHRGNLWGAPPQVGRNAADIPDPRTRPNEFPRQPRPPSHLSPGGNVTANTATSPTPPSLSGNP